MLPNIKFKKVLAFIIIFCVIPVFSSCKTQKKEQAKPETSQFEIKVAQNVVNVYMRYLINEDMEGAKKLYSKDLAKDTKDTGKSDLKIKGFSIDETSEVGQSGLFKVKVARMSLDKPITDLDNCTIKVIKEGSEYKISDVKNETEKEAYLENGVLRVRNKNNIKTNLLIDSGSIPQYAYAKDDKGNLSKQSVPRNNYSVMNFGYEGERVAISTYDKDSYVGIIKIDESQATQGGGGGGGEGQGEGQQGSKSGDQKGTQGGMQKEKPIGKEMTTLDLLKDSKIEFMTFSEGEKSILVQYNKPNMGRCIRVYNVESGELIPVKFEEKYPYGKVEIVFSSFDKDALNFEVIPKDMNDKASVEQAGKYQMSLKDKDYKIKKL